MIYLNPFVTNAPFLYYLETSENHKVMIIITIIIITSNNNYNNY